MNKWLILILIVATAVRLVGLTQIPPALNRDEAAIGYNAYSILLTGKDEHGQSFPLAFQSIGDYKMPLYIYLTALPVKVLGLNELAIRFWSITGGVISVWVLYLIGKKWFKSEAVGLTAAFLMALNPWAVFYSRVGFEANLALALFLLGLNGGLIFWWLALLTYSSSLIFIPLLSLVAIVNRQRLVVFLTLAAVIFGLLWNVSAQKQAITVWSDPATLDYYAHTRTAVFVASPLLARTWWNKYVFFSRLIAKNYLATFSPRFLLTRGGNHPWHQIPGQGYFYVLEIIFALVGGYWLWRQGKPATKLLIFSWLLFAPLPSAITIDAPHATRSLHLLPVVLLLAAYGFDRWRRQVKVKGLLPLAIGLYLLMVSYAGYRYVVSYPAFVAQSLPVDLKESIQAGQTHLTGLNDSTYLYALIYTRFDPNQFQQQALWTPPDTAGLSNAYQFGRFTITN